MYAGGRPNVEAPAAHRQFAAGPVPSVVLVACVLDVRGRSSGRTVSAPLVIVRWHGDWHLASKLGDDSNRVRNVRAAERGRTPARPATVRPPGRDRSGPHIGVHWRSPLAELEAVADRYPMFRVDPPPPAA